MNIMKKLNAVLLSAIMLVGGVMSAFPDAIADPGHSKFIIPTIAGPVDRSLNESAPSVGLPLNIGTVAVVLWAVTYDPNANLGVVTGSSAGCSTSLFTNPDLAGGAGTGNDRLWVLTDTGAGAGAFATGSHGTLAASTITVDGAFGNGGTHLVTIDVGGSGSVLPAGLLEWDEYNFAGFLADQADSVFGLGLYHFTNCADFLPIGGGTTPGTVDETFQVKEVIAGQVLPISATSLFIAGIASTPFVILSGMGLLAGGSFVVLRNLVSKNH